MKIPNVFQNNQQTMFPSMCIIITFLGPELIHNYLNLMRLQGIKLCKILIQTNNEEVSIKKINRYLIYFTSENLTSQMILLSNN